MSRFLPLVLLASLLLVGCQSGGPLRATTTSAAPALEPTHTLVPPTPTESLQASPPSCPPIDPVMLKEMRSLEGQVSQLRGLALREAVDSSLFTTVELNDFVLNDLLADYPAEDALRDAELLTMLGLLPEVMDLRQLYIDLFSEQIAGFYDTEEDRMVVLCEGGFGGAERLTYAHEFVHALQDQLFGFETGLDYSDSACEDDTERCAATRALFEGDATLLQEQWLRRFATEQDLVDLADFFTSYTMPAFDAAPTYIQADFTFPYLQGLFFVRSLYLKDGWSAVDQAYLDPPQSTEQILHPERYPWDAPLFLAAPDLAALADLGWEVAYEGVLGEWAALNMLEVYLQEDEARQAAEGWGGDLLFLLNEPATGQQILLLVLQWDTIRDAHEFTAAYKDYGQTRFGEASRSTTTSAEWSTAEHAVLLERLSNQTLIIIAPAQDLPAVQEVISLPLGLES